MSPNPRVINLHITNHIQYPEPLSILHTSPKKTISIPSIPCHTRIFVESLFKSGHSSSRAFWNPHEKRKTWKCPHQNHLIYQTKKNSAPISKKNPLFETGFLSGCFETIKADDVPSLYGIYLYNISRRSTRSTGKSIRRHKHVMFFSLTFFSGREGSRGHNMERCRKSKKRA